MNLLRLYIIEGKSAGEDDTDWSSTESVWPNASVAWDRDRGEQQISRIVPIGGMLFVLSGDKWWMYRDRDDISGRVNSENARWAEFNMSGVFSLLMSLERGDRGVRVGQNVHGTLDIRAARTSSRDYITLSFSEGGSIPVRSTFPIKPIEGLLLKMTGSQNASMAGNRIASFEADFDPEVIEYLFRAVSDRGDMGRNAWGQNNLD